MTITMTPSKGIDLAAWAEDRVPPDVKQAVFFIYTRTRRHHTGVSWSEIADFMEWNVPRSDVRYKMKRLRRWGVRWDLNKAGSTRIDKKVWPYLEMELGKLRNGA